MAAGKPWGFNAMSLWKWWKVHLDKGAILVLTKKAVVHPGEQVALKEATESLRENSRLKVFVRIKALCPKDYNSNKDHNKMESGSH